MAKSKKEVDTEINLIPFISLLSVLICSLLLTAIWIQLGSIDVKQAIGGSASKTNEKKPTLWTFMKEKGEIRFKLEGVSKVSRSLKNYKLSPIGGKINLDGVSQYLILLKKKGINLSSVLVGPHTETVYEDMIALMDRLKSEGVSDLGVVPL